MERNQSTGEYEVSVAVYPQVTKSDRMPFSTYELPDPVAAIYDETILAYNVGALTLAGGGLRAIVEAICLDQKVCGNNLAEKIDDLVSKDLLAKPQADLLHEERYIGNAALHEVVRPHRQDVDDGLAIVEGLINAIYILPSKAAKLKERREKKST